MNQETAIGKINQMGSVGRIIAIIFNVLFGIAFVALVVGFIVIQILPSDALSVKFDGTASITADGSAIGWDTLGEDIQKGDIDGSISYDGKDMGITNIEGKGSILDITATGTMAKINLNSLSGVILFSLLDVAMCFVTALFAGFLCKAFAVCKSPFDEDVIKKLKMFAFSLIPWAVLSQISSGMAGILFSGKANISVNLNVGIIVIVLVILALAYIFQYGAVLQQQSDETL